MKAGRPAVSLRTVLILGAVTMLVAGCRRPPPPPAKPPEPPERPPREVGVRGVEAALACVKDGQVWLMDGDGNGQRRVEAPGRAVPESLQWSRDAGTIAFWTVDDARGAAGSGTFRLCVCGADASGPALVVHTAERGLGGDRPVFSPDGQALYAAVFGGRDGRGREVGGLLAERFTRTEGVLVVSVAGGVKGRLFADRPVGRGPLRWFELSPDGTAAVAISGRDVKTAHLALLDPSAGRVDERRDRSALYASWSPRHQRLAYLRRTEAGALELRVWAPAKDETVLVAQDLPSDATFSWAPDGRTIAYTSDGEYVLVAEKSANEWDTVRSHSQAGSMRRFPTWSPRGDAVVMELKPSGEPNRTLMRDPIDPAVSGKQFFPGGTRPIFAPG